MKQQYLHTFIWLALFFSVVFWAASPPVSQAGLAAPVSTPEPEAGENNHNEESADDSDGTEGRKHAVTAVIGPGRAVLELGPTGRWIGFSPEWSGGQSVIAGGGFVVLGAGENGEIVELANYDVIVCAGGILPNEFLKRIGIRVETKYGTA